MRSSSMLWRTVGAGVFFLGAVFISAQSCLAISIFNTNLIVNGDAEGGPGSPSGATVGSIPGWTTTGNFTVVQYNAPGGFPTNTDPGPTNRGANFFAGGPSNASSSASQLIDVSSAASIIDAGGVVVTPGGYLGGFAGQGDNALLTVNYFGGGNTLLGSSISGPVTAGERGNATGLLELNANNHLLPLGTRRIEVVLQMTRLAGSYNDGYADNLSLTLASPVPESSSLLLLGTGLLTLGFGVWRRKHAASAR